MGGELAESRDTKREKPDKIRREGLNSSTRYEASGEKYSQKITDGCSYAKKTDLVRKKVLPQATYARIRDKIIAKQKQQRFPFWLSRCANTPRDPVSETDYRG